MPYSRAGHYGPEAMLNAAGALIPGHTVHVYQPGTITPATLYTDATKTTVAANPTVTDGGGNLSFYADPGDYDIKIVTAGVMGSPIRLSVPIDPVDAAQDVDVSAINARVSRIEEYTNVPGLTGGGADDSTAIQAKIAEGPGIVVLPPGTFDASALVGADDVELRGAGYGATVLRLRANANTFLINTPNFASHILLSGPGSGVGTRRFKIRNMSLDGNKLNNPLATVPLVGVYGWDQLLENLRIFDAKAVGLHAQWGDTNDVPAGGSMEASMTNVRVGLCGGDGIVWKGPHDATWLGVIAYQNGGKGIYIAPNGGALKAVDCHSWGLSQSYAWDIQAQFLGIDCEAEGAITAQLRIGASDCQWLGGHIYAATGGTTGIRLGDATPVLGCLIKTKVSNCTTAAINFVNDGGNNDIDLLTYQEAGPNYIGTRNGSTRLRVMRAGTPVGVTGTEHLWPGGMQLGKGLVIGATESLQIGDVTPASWYRNGPDQMRTDDELIAGGKFTHFGTGFGVFGVGATTQRPANPDTTGATLPALETEVNELKALLRAYGFMAV